jgi:hypothetical protein
MTAGPVICKALAEGKSCEEIQSLLKASHPTSKAAREVKSCREQVAWYRSQLNRKLIYFLPSGELLKTKVNGGHDGIVKNGPKVGSGAQMKPESPTLRPASDILLDLFKGNEEALARFLLAHTYFISPVRIREFYLRTGSAARFPDYVRTSNEHHKRKQRGDESSWEFKGEKKTVRVHDNTKARVAFAWFSGLVMGGDRPGRIRGYHVAHIWGHVYDPACFTAGWNLCLMPGFLKLFTEEQDRIELLHQVIQQRAFDLYFKDGAIGLPRPDFVTSPGLDLHARFSGIKTLLLGDK